MVRAVDVTLTQAFRQNARPRSHIRKREYLVKDVVHIILQGGVAIDESTVPRFRRRSRYDCPVRYATERGRIQGVEARYRQTPSKAARMVLSKVSVV